MATIPIPTLEDMRQQYLDDVELSAIDAGIADPPIEIGSDFYVRGTALANLTTVVCERVSAADKDALPSTCSDERIEEWRISLGLPEIPAQGATGKVIARLDASSGTATDGTVLTRNGYQYQVVGGWTGVVDGSEITIEAVDTGEVTNAKAGERLYWRSAPPGFKSYVEVSTNEPLTGGVDAETPERKRERVTERIANPAVSGNWSAVIEVVETVLPTVRAYPYPGLGGPSSCKVVLTKQIDPDNLNFSRIPTTAQLTRARQAAWSDVADGTKYIVQAVAEEVTSVALEITIPDASSSGGSGNGWINDTPWPPLTGAETKITVTAVTSSKVFRVDATTTTAPVDGQTYIAWWSPQTQKFQTGLITAHSGSTGVWVLTVNEPMVDETNVAIAVGDYVSPAAANLEAYGETWRDIMANLGPGENTTEVARLPRAARHPAIDAQDSPTLSTAHRKLLMTAHPEMVDCDYSYRSTTTPTVPGTVDQAPNVLKLDNFGVYSQ